MGSGSALNIIDFFISPSQAMLGRDDLTKSRIFVLGALLLVAVSIMDLIHLAIKGNLQTGGNELQQLALAAASLILHYKLGRPQYFIIPFAMGLVLLLCFTFIVPSGSLLAPTMLWLPLVTAIVSFVSGRWWGSLFALVMIVTAIGLNLDRVPIQVKIPVHESLASYMSALYVVLFQVLAAALTMVLVYRSLHRNAREELATVQNQAAQMLRSSENSDFSFNLHRLINSKLKPLRDEIRNARDLSPADWQRPVHELQQVLGELRDYPVFLRSVQELDPQAPKDFISWTEISRRLRSLIPGRHGALVLEYEDKVDTSIPHRMDSKLLPLIMEGLRILCYQSKSQGQAHLRLGSRVLTNELVLIYKFTLSQAESLDAKSLVLNEQKLELSNQIMQQTLQQLGGSVQLKHIDQILWLQISLPLAS